MDISRSALGTLSEIGNGNYGTVYAAPDLALADVPGTLLVKIFHANSLDRGESDRLRSIVQWRESLDHTTRATLDGLAAWPVRVVVDGRKVVGIVMRRAPEHFFFDFTPLARSGKSSREPTTIESLFAPALATRARGIPVADDDDLLTRLISCARLALFMSILHRHGIAYGDLSQGNVLVSNDPAPPTVLVIDCDAAYPTGMSHSNKQHGTKAWLSPEEDKEKAPLDIKTDVYKLSVAIVRILATSSHIFQITRASHVEGILDSPGVDLLTRGVGQNRDDRPSADEIYAYLIAEIDGRTSPPIISRCEVSEPYVVVGASIDLVIDVDHATAISLRTPDGRTLTVPLAEAHSALRLSAVETGSDILTARNAFGSVSTESYPVRVVRPPDLVAVHYPEPELPSLKIGDMAVLRRGLEAAEMTGAHLTSPFEQLARFERQAEVYDGLFAPTQAIRDYVQIPDNLFPRMSIRISGDDDLNPLGWHIPPEPAHRWRPFHTIFRPSRRAHR